MSVFSVFGHAIRLYRKRFGPKRSDGR
jgi:hypothetical protein